MLNQDFANFVIEAIFDGQFLNHVLADALRDSFGRLGLDEVALDEALYNLGRHVIHVVAGKKHSKRVLSAKNARSKEDQFTGSVERVQGGEESSET
jgi:hypothetical protein